MTRKPDRSGEVRSHEQEPSDTSTSNDICRDVLERLREDPGLEAGDVCVRVERRQVILEGWVQSELARQIAGVVAMEAPGVQGVKNNLRVQRRRSRSRQ